MPKKRVTKKQLIEAAIKCRGVQKDMADFLGITRNTVGNRVKSDKTGEIAAAMNESEESTTDKAHSNIAAAVEAGDIHASKFWLTTKGKNRGFTRRTEIEGDLGLNHRGQVHIYLPPNGRDGQPRIESSKSVDGANEPPRIESADGVDGNDGGGQDDDDHGQTESKSG